MISDKLSLDMIHERRVGVAGFRERRVSTGNALEGIQRYLAERISPEKLPLVFSLSPQLQAYLCRLWESHERRLRRDHRLDPEPDFSLPE